MPARVGSYWPILPIPVPQVQSYDASCGFRVEYVDGDEEDISMDALLQLPLAAPGAMVGRAVIKHFPGHGRFSGEVTAYMPEHGFHVQYADGDEEVITNAVPCSRAAGSETCSWG